MNNKSSLDKLSESLLVKAILIFNFITVFLFYFFLPYNYAFTADIQTTIGVLVTSFYIIYQKQKILTFGESVKYIFTTMLIGSIINAISLSIIVYFILLMPGILIDIRKYFVYQLAVELAISIVFSIIFIFVFFIFKKIREFRSKLMI